MFQTITSGAAVRWLVLCIAAVVAACGPSAGQPSASPGLPSPTATPMTTPSPSASPSAIPTAETTAIAPTESPAATLASLPPDGTWQVELTAAELEAAGWPADVTPSGTYTWTFQDGRATIAYEPNYGSGAYCEAEMEPLDEGFRLTYSAGECGGEVDEIGWELDDDGLHLFLITTNAPVDQQKAYLETKAWQPAEPPVSTVSPGLVDVGGRELFMECRGSGSPTVVFMVGTGAPRTQMRALEDEILEQPVRVCDYDRAGSGDSDPTAQPQNALEVVDDLAALLTAANVPAPYVLVGQSVGGDEAWLYAGQHPAGVAGVMIMNAGAWVLDWDAVKGVLTDAEIAEERRGFEATLGPLKQAQTPVRGVPYVVMLSTIAQCGSPSDICGREYPFYEDWARELAGRRTDGRFVSVDAGHAIFDTRADIVVEEIGKLIDAAIAQNASFDGAFDIGDRSLWLECVGHGSPTFILESGEGVAMSQMTDLRNALGPRGMACTYERANVGRSGDAPTPRTGLEVASDLHALLEAADVAGPYFLIGHSAGGILVQQYAKAFPADVMGVLAMNPVPPYRPWVAQGFPTMTAQERLEETAYVDGQNGEALDYRAISETLETAPAPDIPFELFISTIAQCAHTYDICGRSYAAYEAVMQEIAESWPDGNLSQLEADHELLRHQDEVLALVDSVLERSAH